MKSPPPLYDICLKVAVWDSTNVRKFRIREFRSLPNNVLFDFYYTMYLEKRSCLLTVEFSNIDVFSRMLNEKHKRVKLLKSFQALVNHGTDVPHELIQDYGKFVKTVPFARAVNIAIEAASFFNEGGWFNHSIKLLVLAEELCVKQEESVETLGKLLECYHRRLYAETFFCEFTSARNTFASALKVIEKLKKLDSVPNLAGIYANFSYMFFQLNEYDEALKWSKKALKLLNDRLPTRVVIEVLRRASRVCVMKRRFNQAGLLIEQAVNLAAKMYKLDGHPSYSDTLLDYAFYLINFDSIEKSVSVYEKSLHIRHDVFETNNIHLAQALEDMAYALYVNEYSSGRFYMAREHAERALRLMERILPGDHLLLASAKRVKALILEEIALDMREGNDSQFQEKYLIEAEQLHKAALDLSFKAFGEKNVQTAKHYGNFGRLYQSMRQYEQAEAMHLRAIAIKEELLGSDDYEVGLSVGHLASLYNYHMKRYHEAEKLYMRSMEINMNLFGDTYSGFEYDYRGLMNVYSKLGDQANVMLYTNKMREWTRRREQLTLVLNEKRDDDVEQLRPLDELLDKFFKLC